MGLIDSLNDIDTDLFIFLNSLNNQSLDTLMIFLSDRLSWVPFYAFLIFLIFKKYLKRVWIVLISIAVMITISDQFASTLLKPLVARPRPCHEIILKPHIHLVKGCGGAYGFISSHASNTFAIATFLYFLFDRKRKWLLIFLWASIISYSRIYLGVHYPGDIIAGALLGLFLGWGFFKIISKFLTPTT